MQFACPSSHLPISHRRMRLFRTRTCRATIGCCRPRLPFSVRLGRPLLRRCYQLACSPRLCFGPRTVPVCVGRPIDLPSRATFVEQAQRASSPLRQVTPKCRGCRTLSILFSTTFGETLRRLSKCQRKSSVRPLLIYLTRRYFQTNVPRRSAIQ